MSKEQLALDLIEKWQSQEYGCEAQSKAVLQCAIIEVIEQYEKEIEVFHKFIKNGVELGYIQVPDNGVDSAFHTIKKVIEL